MTLEEVKLGLVEDQIVQIKAELIAEQDICDTVDSWGLGKYVGIQLALNLLDKIELRSTEEE